MADTGFRVSVVDDHVAVITEDEDELVTYMLSPEEAESLAVSIYEAVRSIE